MITRFARRSRLTGVLATVLLALLLAALAGACGDDDDDTTAATATTSTSGTTTESAMQLEGNLTIFAASSLTDVFDALADAFDDAHPDVSITFNYQSSSSLATQINELAPADIFASANDAQMKVVTDAGNAENPVTFATNSPVIVVPAGDHKVTKLDDLASDGIRLVLAEEDVPVGKYARDILTNASTAAGLGTDFSARALANLQSNEANVRAVLTKVQLGEADAGIVYATDAATAPDDVDVVEIPAEYNVVASYPIAVVNETGNPDAAAAWVGFVLSDEGQAILASFGFGPPE